MPAFHNIKKYYYFGIHVLLFIIIVKNIEKNNDQNIKVCVFNLYILIATVIYIFKYF